MIYRPILLDENGDSHTIIMGSYGIGIGRAVAAIAETLADDNGLVWPLSVAPYEVSVVAVNLKDEASTAAAEDIYNRLRQAGIEVVYDDRDVRPGVKFADHELVGIPIRVTVGPKGLANGVVEISDRASGERSELPLDSAVSTLVDRVRAGR